MTRSNKLGPFSQPDDSARPLELEDRQLQRELHDLVSASVVREDRAVTALAVLRPRLAAARRRSLVVRGGAASTLVAAAVLVFAVMSGTVGSHGRLNIPPAGPGPGGAPTSASSSLPTPAHGGHRHADAAATTPRRGDQPLSNPSAPPTSGPTAPPIGTTPGGTTPGTGDGGDGPPTTVTTAPGTTTTTTPAMQSKSFTTAGGTVTVSWDALHMVVDQVVTQPGWTSGWQYDGPDECEFHFWRTSPEGESELHLQLVSGQVVITR